MNEYERNVVSGLHLYQPPRVASHKDLISIHTDPIGIDWTKVITRECYDQLTAEGVLKLASFDAYATLRHDLERINPAITRELKESLASHGIGDSFLHIILPHLDRREIDLLIQSGKNQFEADTGTTPKWFWAPESGLNLATLESLAGAGYEGVLCAPHQVRRFDNTSGENRPTVVVLPSGNRIVLLAFDRPISQSFAFHDKSNADRFALQQILTSFNRVPPHGVLAIMTDGETFGHHDKGGDKFLEYLLKVSLPRQGIGVISINNLMEQWQSSGYDPRTRDPEGVLVENTAWSCMCGDLRRWKGGCSCTGGGEWKAPYYKLFAQFNEAVRAVADQSLGNHDQELSTHFKQALYNPGGESSDPELSILSARASALASRTSCATFFGDPHTSGRINVLYATQALRHLEDAGLQRDADPLRNLLHDGLSKVPDPTQRGQTLRQTMSYLLDDPVEMEAHYV